MRYRKKIVEIEAVRFDGRVVGQWDGVTGDVVAGTCPSWFPAVVRDDVEHGHQLQAGSAALILDRLYWRAPDGSLYAVKAGDWITRGPDGLVLPCPAEDFAVTYEPA